MPFNGTEGAPIELETASQWTAAYRNACPDSYRAHFFGKDILNRILDQESCMGIRMYYAIDSKGQNQLILVGADAQEKDLITGVIADYSCPCPNMCGEQNALNC